MPYLTCIGPQGGNKYNVSGYGSRGYWVFRRGRTVFMRWGAVKTVRGKAYRVEWAHGWVWERQERFRTPADAGAAAAERVRLLRLPSSGYALLHSGQRIGGLREVRRSPSR